MVQVAYSVTNPATGEVEERYDTASDAQIAATLDRAEEAYRTWGVSSSRQSRADLLTKVADLHLDRKEELAEIITHEMGKTHEEAVGEVEFSADIYRYYADHAARRRSCGPS